MPSQTMWEGHWMYPLKSKRSPTSQNARRISGPQAGRNFFNTIGQKQTRPRRRPRSASPSRPDIGAVVRRVRSGPLADLSRIRAQAVSWGQRHIAHALHFAIAAIHYIVGRVMGLRPDAFLVAGPSHQLADWSRVRTHPYSLLFARLRRQPVEKPPSIFDRHSLLG